MRQHFDYGSPSRGEVVDENHVHGHHKPEHYTSMDDKFENHCSEGYVQKKNILN